MSQNPNPVEEDKEMGLDLQASNLIRAKGHINLGESDGAEKLLQEVSEHGNDGQREEAHGLLNTPSMDWLDAKAEDSEPMGQHQSAPRSPVLPSDSTVERPPNVSLQKRPAVIAIFAAIAAVWAFYALRSEPSQKSVALEAERVAEPPKHDDIEIGVAAPLAPTPEPVPAQPATAAPPSGPALPPAERLPGVAGFTEQKVSPPAGLPAEPAASPEEPQPPVSAEPAPTVEKTNPAATDAKGQEPQPADQGLATISQRLEALQALIERLERNEKVMNSRIAGLELGGLQRSVNNETEEKPKKAARRSPPNPLPVESLHRRPASAAPPMPFSVVSVDSWGGEKRIVVRSGGQLHDLRPGETRDGWRIDSADGQTVTVSNAKGSYQIEAAQGDSR